MKAFENFSDSDLAVMDIAITQFAELLIVTDIFRFPNTQPPDKDGNPAEVKISLKQSLGTIVRCKQLTDAIHDVQILRQRN